MKRIYHPLASRGPSTDRINHPRRLLKSQFALVLSCGLSGRSYPSAPYQGHLHHRPLTTATTARSVPTRVTCGAPTTGASRFSRTGRGGEISPHPVGVRPLLTEGAVHIPKEKWSRSRVAGRFQHLYG